ncbi:MAG: NAD(P)H-binding protein, partial [Erythrobacter sp.]|nr:NAD(P)H-binding protein [Erythrobacter sp.]
LSGSPDIAWTAARPGWLLDQPHTGDFAVSESDLPPDSLRTRRADLAQFLIDCATGEGSGEDWVRRTPFVARPEADEYERPTALLDEFLPH